MSPFGQRLAGGSLLSTIVGILCWRPQSSTPVVNRRRPRRAPRSTASETRAKILAAARIGFSRAGFDQLGVRETACAGVDPAIVNRLFRSTEALFVAVAEGTFVLDAPFEGLTAGLGLRIAKYLAGPMAARGPDEFDEFAFLMRSAASPTAAPLLSTALHAGFVTQGRDVHADLLLAAGAEGDHRRDGQDSCSACLTMLAKPAALRPPTPARHDMRPALSPG